MFIDIVKALKGTVDLHNISHIMVCDILCKSTVPFSALTLIVRWQKGHPLLPPLPAKNLVPLILRGSLPEQLLRRT